MVDTWNNKAACGVNLISMSFHTQFLSVFGIFRDNFLTKRPEKQMINHAKSLLKPGLCKMYFTVCLLYIAPHNNMNCDLVLVMRR